MESPGYITIIKTDAVTGTPIGGATFNIYDSAGVLRQVGVTADDGNNDENQIKQEYVTVSYLSNSFHDLSSPETQDISNCAENDGKVQQKTLMFDVIQIIF